MAYVVMCEVCNMIASSVWCQCVTPAVNLCQDCVSRHIFAFPNLPHLTMIIDLQDQITTIAHADEVLERNKILNSIKKRWDLLLDESHLVVSDKLEKLDTLQQALTDLINDTKLKLRKTWDQITDQIGEVKIRAEKSISEGDQEDAQAVIDELKFDENTIKIAMLEEDSVQQIVDEVATSLKIEMELNLRPNKTPQKTQQESNRSSTSSVTSSSITQRRVPTTPQKTTLGDPCLFWFDQTTNYAYRFMVEAEKIDRQLIQLDKPMYWGTAWIVLEEGQVMLVGGKTTECNIYNWDTNTLQGWAPITEIRDRIGLCRYSPDEIYAFGGYNEEYEKTFWTVEIFTRSSGLWRPGPKLPSEIYCTTSLLLQTQIYIAGVGSPRVFRLNPFTAKYTDLGIETKTETIKKLLQVDDKRILILNDETDAITFDKDGLVQGTLMNVRLNNRHYSNCPPVIFKTRSYFLTWDGHVFSWKETGTRVETMLKFSRRRA